MQGAWLALQSFEIMTRIGARNGTEREQFTGMTDPQTRKTDNSSTGSPLPPASYHRKMLALFGGLTILFLGAAALTFWVDSLAFMTQSAELDRSPSTLRDIPEYINLTITETGIAAITTEELRPFNWQLASFSHDTINLSRQGESVPYYIDEGGQTLFFLAEAITSTIAAPTVYQLSLGEGLSMPVKEAAASGRGNNRGTFQHVWEENSNFLAETSNSDPWYGRLLLAPQTWNFPLSGIRPSGGRGRSEARETPTEPSRR